MWNKQDAKFEVSSCRYHSAKTLRLMGAYRIGRIHQPWTNFTPPIRGGLYRKYQDREESISSEDEVLNSYSSHNSLHSSTTSLELSQDDEPKASHEPHHTSSIANSAARRIYGNVADVELSYRGPLPDKSEFSDSYTPSTDISDIQSSRPLTPGAYTALQIQTEINNDLRDYPPLDAKTQRNITLKYQALHQRVKDEGFYDCRYIEYGKELVRYAILFTIFFTLLRSEWYLTSAAFLGLFWVGRAKRLDSIKTNWFLASNNVYSTRCGPSRNHS